MADLSYIEDNKGPVLVVCPSCKTSWTVAALKRWGIEYVGEPITCPMGWPDGKKCEATITVKEK